MFKTHDIQDLSQRGLKKFGKRLGSPETYTRQFRELRQNNVYKIDKINTPNSNEKSWFVVERSSDV